MTEKVTTEQSLDAIAKAIVTCIEKGDKYKGEYTEYEDAKTKYDVAFTKAEDFYRTAGRHLIDAQKKTGGGALFKTFYKEQCHLEKSRIDELLALGRGSKSLAEVRERSRTSVQKSREKKKSQEPPATDDDVAGDRPNLHTETEWKALRAKLKRIPELEARIFELTTRVNELEDILVTRDNTIADLRMHIDFDTSAPKVKKAKKLAVTDLPASASPPLADDLPTGTHAGQDVFDSPQEAHASPPLVDEPYPGHAAFTAKKATDKAAKKAAADAEKVAA